MPSDVSTVFFFVSRADGLTATGPTLVSPLLSCSVVLRSVSQAAGGHVSRVGRVNDNLNLSRAIGDMSYKRNRLRRTKDQIISAEPDVCR